jgi:hypothetical protein
VRNMVVMAVTKVIGSIELFLKMVEYT